ncbi:MAG: T9SS type A sorting domain-containing protein [Bacteroidetes bacterium]|nr:T9SS type A sorting domain-containing protein [Bacteroidota bacterium]
MTLRNFAVSVVMLGISMPAFAQKDCSNDHMGNIPLIDLTGGYFNGVQGGLYPGGTNERPAAHLTQCVNNALQIQPLNTEGVPSADGKIVMIGIGASNPMTEFQKFIELSNTYEPVNDNLTFLNACLGGQGIQKMYDITDNYWSSVVGKLETEGLSPEQVQVVWVEQDNTNSYDTVFPGAANALMDDFRLLLVVIKTLFPNVQITYVTARAYAGYADPIDPELSTGLLYPRDYYNGWALKFLVEKIIDHAPGYESAGPSAQVPLVTWGTYHWTDGSTPRLDGLYLDCELDVSGDGLHLAGPGEEKMGQQLFNYFKTDTTAKYWYLDQEVVGIQNTNNEQLRLQVYPNPITGNTINFNAGAFNLNEKITYTITSASGKIVFADATISTEQVKIDLPELASGIYYITAVAASGSASASFVVAR